MANSEILHPKAVAVITGAGSGIGLAAALKYAKYGMSLYLADIDESSLQSAIGKVKAVDGVGEVFATKTDVSKVEDVVELRDKVLEEFGEIHILMANAGISKPTPAFSLSTPLSELQSSWHQVLDTNFFGVLNVCQAFAPIMARQENASAVIVTGSKQGITCPPGNAGYNVSKAGVKTFTEQLAHELRNVPDSRCSAHLFVPGWVHTGLTGAKTGAPKPSGAWTPEQTVDYMVDKVFEEGDFYVICPDNETNNVLDKARIQWNLDDILQNRPALSRWHPNYQARFDDFIAAKQGLSAGARSRSRGRRALGSQDSGFPTEADISRF
ncbi:short-chain dehydrogenase/reductase SDR [Kwoniella mangroviensis CBS 10435]|uniref:Short-chain dehydrogenase/reductase SDR n=1 Tax=Kwoniella mangroviensis CBS 10435 TaxID=1331196 RepID=A0A1B9IH94_9TREE|nr:short-chain dehydrogenase/reductase SDR [Kwoniella mangroviensis CBS 8507]OCF54996.1 short-chain dehydrogenase/reductase SDR [Kwoniella mangroviensis CBS 10435]OCF67772.1 short-chain dehydrogenase/reductase SDR [Kwoniella mangroviensis CBS 8507]OCF73018.1 short-chain dehydrogenase/reductase SDR [Kwoniella mangroviensis CBS 8886]